MGNMLQCCNGNTKTDSTELGLRSRNHSDTTGGSPSRINRIFLVGNEAVGKTTLIKQMQKLCVVGNKGYEMYDSNWNMVVPFSDEERIKYRQQIYQNILKSVGTLILQARSFGLVLDNEERQTFAEEILEFIGEELDAICQREELQIDRELARKIEALWNLDSAIQSTWNRRREFPITDSTEYFMESAKIQEVASPHYTPSVDDILHVRNPTMKTVDFNFRINKVKFNIRDAGGQAEERKHLPNYLSRWLAQSRPADKNFILFVASLADYDQKHPTFKEKTMLDESIDLLTVLLSLEPLKQCGFMFFLNKTDILQQKLHSFQDFNQYFHQYIERLGMAGRRLTLKQAENIIAARFADAISETPRAHDPLYCKFTCAVDTGLMEGIFAIVRKDIINDLITDDRFFT